MGWEDALEKEMATYSSVLALRTPGTGEPGGLPSMGEAPSPDCCYVSSHSHSPKADGQYWKPMLLFFHLCY